MIYNLRLFTRATILPKLDRRNLLCFLRKYQDYFSTKNPPYRLPVDEISDDFDFEALAREFATPVFDGTTKMFDALELIECMSRPKYAPFVSEYLEDSPFKQDFEPENAALNNALLVYLRDPIQLFKIRESVQIENPQHYTIVKGKKLDAPLKFQEAFVPELSRRLDDIYENKRFGRGVRVKHYTVQDEEFFLIRKGLPHTYQATVGKDLSTVGIYFRPEQFDVVIYSPARNELKLAISNARKWMRSVYPITFSQVFFGAADGFEEKRCLSFAEFQQNGEKALQCAPGNPITSVIVTEITSIRSAGEDTLLKTGDRGVCMEQTLRVDNFFLRARSFGVSLRDLGEITALKLMFYFGREKRTVILKNGNGCGFKLDARGLLIEKWLYDHGFIVDV